MLPWQPHKKRQLSDINCPFVKAESVRYKSHTNHSPLFLASRHLTASTHVGSTSPGSHYSSHQSEVRSPGNGTIITFVQLSSLFFLVVAPFPHNNITTTTYPIEVVNHEWNYYHPTTITTTTSTDLLKRSHL